MKKTIIICLICLLFTSLSAAADSVWMPMDDFFIGTWDPENENTCESTERKIYMAAGENGYVTAIRTPLDSTELATYPNGTEFIIDFLCGVRDKQWGAIRSVRLPGETTFKEDYTGKSGYLPIEEIVHAYDTDAFAELHCNSIFGYTESEFNFCDPYFPFVIWTYPHSGVQLDVVTEDLLNWFCHEYQENTQYFPLRIDRTYTDENGGRWLSVRLSKPYAYGWLNLDDPMAGAVIQNYD